jgi:Flp pilus assembly protein TadD
MIGMVRGAFAPAEALPEASAAAHRALELAPMLGEAHATLGTIRSFSGDLVGGLQACERALELKTSNGTVYLILGRALSAFERHEEALAVAHTAVRLDPLSALLRTALGDTYYFAREHEKSVFHFRMAIEVDPRFDGAHTGLARAYEMLGRFDEARAAYEEGQRVGGGVAGPSFGLAHLAASAGNEAEARRILAELTAARASRVHLGVGHRRGACPTGRHRRDLRMAGDGARGARVRDDPAAGPPAVRRDPRRSALLADRGAGRLGRECGVTRAESARPPQPGGFMPASAQSYQAHRRFLPPYHFFVLPVLIINVFVELVRLYRSPTLYQVWLVVVASALLGLALMARGMALTVQSRLIRLEERLRLQRLMPAEEHAAIAALRLGQLVGTPLRVG